MYVPNGRKNTVPDGRINGVPNNQEYKNRIK
jgi:hypothetical protein